MDIIRYTDDFFAMERDLDLFSQRIDGIPWWDPVRHDVFYFIYYQLSGVNLVQPSQKLPLRRILHFVMRRWMNVKLWFKVIFGNYDVLALRAPRLAMNGSKDDVILDDILACTPGRILSIDTFPIYYHIKLPKKCVHPFTTSQLSSLNEAVRIRFGQRLDVESLVSLRLVQFFEALIQYGHLLDRVKPKLIVLIQNGIEKALFQAAYDRSIPVIEAQHGLINYVHPAYSYPTEIAAGSLASLPKIFLAFSQHWLDQCHYPVSRSVVTGSRQLFLEPIRPVSDDILVLSADIYEKVIEEVLRPAAVALPKRRFIYKLHPNQFTHYGEIKERLSDLPNIHVLSNDETFRQLMHRSSTVLCIQSTGVYEALQAGLFVYVLAKLDFETHTDVFGHSNVKIIRNHEEFVREVSSSVRSKNSSALPVFFQRYDAAATTKLMGSLSA